MNTTSQQSHTVRQEAANRRRTAQLRNVTNKAARATDQIVNNAVSRKKLEIGDANTFTVTLSHDDDENDPMTDADGMTDGWQSQTKLKLPTQLAARLQSLGDIFQMKSYEGEKETIK